MIQNYIVRNEDSSLKLVVSNVKPKKCIGILPKGERVEWMQLEMVDDGFGSMVEKLTVNAQLKSDLKQQWLDAKMEKQQALELLRKKRRIVRKKMRDFKKEEVVGLEQIQDQLDNIVAFLREHMGFEE